MVGISKDDALTVAMQAPILIIQDLFSADECRRFIEFWEGNEKASGAVASTGTGFSAVKEQSKRRQDVFIPDDHALLHQVTKKVADRVGPEILKAFRFRVEIMGGFLIVCYYSG